MKLRCHNLGRLKAIASKVSTAPVVPAFGFISFYVTDKDTRILADLNYCRVSIIDKDLFSFVGEYDGPVSFAIERSYLMDMITQSDRSRSGESVLELEPYVTAQKETAYKGKLVSDGGKRKLTVQMWPYSDGLKMTDLTAYRPAARLNHEELLIAGGLVRPVSKLLPRPDDVSPFAAAVLMLLTPEEAAYAVSSDTVSLYATLDDPQTRLEGDTAFLHQYVTPQQIAVARTLLQFAGEDESSTEWLLTKDPTPNYGGKNNDKLQESTKSYCLSLPVDESGESKIMIAALGSGTTELATVVRGLFYNEKVDAFADRQVQFTPEDIRDMADALMVSGHVMTKDGSVHQDFNLSFAPDDVINLYAKEKFQVHTKVTMPEIQTKMSSIQVGGDRIETFMVTSVAFTPFIALLNQLGKDVTYDLTAYASGPYRDGAKDTLSTVMAVGKTPYFKEARVLIMGQRA